MPSSPSLFMPFLCQLFGTRAQHVAELVGHVFTASTSTCWCWVRPLALKVSEEFVSRCPFTSHRTWQLFVCVCPSITGKQCTDASVILQGIDTQYNRHASREGGSQGLGHRRIKHSRVWEACELRSVSSLATVAAVGEIVEQDARGSKNSQFQSVSGERGN